ncbi:glucokinase [Fontibacillus phaseoli]|uniref:Glucokinase n=1 Tax=Fontibacillus phaseoli TaxID=1416533 RepID=A0A369BE36_9BACL|nr:ROK family protein [Fontibacillus phaseoli]RCX19813.1 glucokinase [Fontibacillus phaseoli]
MVVSGDVAIGIDLGGTNIKAGLVTGDGAIIHRLSLPTEAQKGPEALMDRLAEIISALQAYARDRAWEIRGVGVGSAGQIDSGKGVVMGATANLPGWAGMRLSERLQSRTGLPVAVDNDANAMAFGEAWVGAGRHWRDFVCVTLGTGVGGCLILGRRPYRGRDGFAGEFGHHVIEGGGIPCNCGRIGCWEQYASVTALMRMARERENADLLATPKGIFNGAREGYGPALDLVDGYARYIAMGLANLIHLFNPQGIVVGGAVTEQGDFLLGRIRQAVAGCLLPVYGEAAEATPIISAELGNDGGVIGAVAGYFI